jgi:hypothetical protein
VAKQISGSAQCQVLSVENGKRINKKSTLKLCFHRQLIVSVWPEGDCTMSSSRSRKCPFCQEEHIHIVLSLSLNV